MTNYCVARTEEGEACVHKVKGARPNVGDRDIIIDGDVVAIIEGDSPAGKLCALLESLDEIHQSERNCDGLPFGKMLDQLLTTVMKTPVPR